MYDNPTAPKVSNLRSGSVNRNYVKSSELVTGETIENGIKAVSDLTQAISDSVDLAPSQSRKELSFKNTNSDTLRINNFSGKGAHSIVDDTIDTTATNVGKVISKARIDDDIIVASTSGSIITGDSNIHHVKNDITSKITIGRSAFHMINQSDGDYNPYVDANITDIIKSYTSVGKIFCIYRGGYIGILDTINDTRSITVVIPEVTVADVTSYKFTKDSKYFTKFLQGDVVTSTSFDGEKYIAITTTNDAYLYNIVANTSEKITTSADPIIDCVIAVDTVYILTVKDVTVDPLVGNVKLLGYKISNNDEIQLDMPVINGIVNSLYVGANNTVVASKGIGKAGDVIPSNLPIITFDPINLVNHIEILDSIDTGVANYTWVDADDKFNLNIVDHAGLIAEFTVEL